LRGLLRNICRAVVGRTAGHPGQEKDENGLERQELAALDHMSDSTDETAGILPQFRLLVVLRQPTSRYR
jgi:hypothetical protein